MRLIDADAIPFVDSEDGVAEDYAFRYDINEMPTVDPVKDGAWNNRKIGITMFDPVVATKARLQRRIAQCVAQK